MISKGALNPKIRFTLKQLSYFVAAGEANSIIKASENIHVSQPSISNAISGLEGIFGFKLFIRHHAQGMSLTPAGRKFIREAKALLTGAERLNGFAGELSNQVIGTIELGCFIPLASIVSPILCQGFMTRFPETEVNVIEAHQADLLQLLHQGSIDIALTYDLQLTNKIQFIPLASLPPYVLLSDRHQLSGRQQIALEELTAEPMILLDLPLSNAYFMSLFSRYNLKPLIQSTTKHPEVQRSLVAAEQGYALANVRPTNKFTLDGHGLRYIPLSGDHLDLTIGIARVDGIDQFPAQLEFLNYCKKTIRNDSIPGMTGYD